MADVTIRQRDNVYLKIQCDEGIHRELREHYTFFIENAKFHPLVKNKLWDGKKRLYDMKSGQLYAGLLKDLQKNLKEWNYTFECDIPESTDITPEDVIEFTNSLKPYSEKDGGVLTPKDYQYAAVYMGLKFKRRVIISPTASGKSLIIYTIMMKLLEELEGKILIIVPLVGLVKQLFKDFDEYSKLIVFDTEENCHQISAGIDKNSNKKVYISTYQSIYKLEPEYFSQFQAVLIDETHKAKSDSFVKILEKCTNAEYRLGFTGTLDGWEVNELVVQGLLGKKTRVAKTSDLMDRGDLAKLNIKFYELQYPKEDKKGLEFKTYAEEIDWIISYNRRNHFIQQLAEYVDGNVLILFQFVEKHGDVLNELIESKTNKTVHYVHGGVDADKREEIRQIVENTNNNILIASYGTFSTGINIRNIHHIVLGSTTKSVVRVLQSIGRGLRLGENKDSCIVHDLCDNLVKKSKQNLALMHGLKRIEIYNNQNFEYEIIRIQL